VVMTKSIVKYLIFFLCYGTIPNCAKKHKGAESGAVAPVKL